MKKRSAESRTVFWYVDFWVERNGSQLTLPPIQILATANTRNEMPAKPKHRRTNLRLWNGDIQGLRCIGSGVSGLVFEIDGSKVVKVALGTPRSIKDIETEREIYQTFGQKPHNFDFNYILRCLDVDDSRGLVFEHCKGTVRSRLKSQPPVSPEMRMKWALQACRGLRFAHECKVIQGDS